MGDRANAVILDGDKAVFLYTHWRGTELPETVRLGLITGADRWDDSPYLARIIFEQMIAGCKHKTTGFGISARLLDNEYDLLVLDVDNKLVLRLPETRYKASRFENPTKSIQFTDYIAIPRTWNNLCSTR